MNTLLLCKGGALVAAFTALSAIAYGAACTPTASDKRTGVRGLKRQRALAKGNGWEHMEPVVRWLGARLRGLVSSEALDACDRQIQLAGGFLGLLPEELFGLSIVCAVAGFAAGLAADVIVKFGTMLAVMTMVFGALAPYLSVSSAAAERSKAIARRLPNAIDLLALSMGAGLDFPGALRQTLDKSGTPDDPLIEEFGLILQSLQLGRTRRQALEEFAERVPIDAVHEFVGAVVQAELRGNPLAEVLRIQAEVSRQRRTVLAEETASKAGVRMILPLLFLFVAILILIAGPMMIQLTAKLS